MNQYHTGLSEDIADSSIVLDEKEIEDLISRSPNVPKEISDYILEYCLEFNNNHASGSNTVPTLDQFDVTSIPACTKREASETTDLLLLQPKKRRLTLNSPKFTVPITTNDSYLCFFPKENKVYVKLNIEFPVEFSWNKQATELKNLLVRATPVLINDQHKVLQRCPTHTSQAANCSVLEAGADEKNVRYELDSVGRPSVIIPAIDKSDLGSDTTTIRVYFLFKCLNSCFKCVPNLRDKKTAVIFTIEDGSCVYAKFRLLTECAEKPKRSYKRDREAIQKKESASLNLLRSSHVALSVPEALPTPPQTDEEYHSSYNQISEKEELKKLKEEIKKLRGELKVACEHNKLLAEENEILKRMNYTGPQN